MSSPIKIQRDGFIATVILNRPERLNDITKSMWQQLTNEIEALSFDDSLRCIIIRGAGEKAFSPGCDILEFASERSNKQQAIEYGLLMHTAAATLASCPVPVVAQIHGICIGGGLEIASLCDIRICGESSRFGVPINHLGLVMAYPELTPIVRLTGPDVALEILLEGRIFGAQEAKEKGLVTRIVPDEQVAAEAQEAAKRIVDGAPLAARWHKKSLRRLADSAAITSEEYLECFDCFDTDDYHTGYSCFLAKTK
ncbi:MAG: enoyl-CoA hydratase-related protein, partial [Burkholderiaceae bacterium]|nr:enoyl-CoA hydratase-related protein [Burkholderiaceae bacterium]